MSASCTAGPVFKHWIAIQWPSNRIWQSPANREIIKHELQLTVQHYIKCPDCSFYLSNIHLNDTAKYHLYHNCSLQLQQHVCHEYARTELTHKRRANLLFVCTNIIKFTLCDAARHLISADYHQPSDIHAQSKN